MEGPFQLLSETTTTLKLEDTTEIDLRGFKHLYATLHKQSKRKEQKTRLIETCLDESMPEFESEFDKLFIGDRDADDLNDNPFAFEDTTTSREEIVRDLMPPDWNPEAERNRQEAEAVGDRVPRRLGDRVAPIEPTIEPPRRRAHDRGRLFFCCQCNDGPRLVAINPMCDCHHVRCSMCRLF